MENELRTCAVEVYELGGLCQESATKDGQCIGHLAQPHHDCFPCAGTGLGMFAETVCHACNGRGYDANPSHDVLAEYLMTISGLHKPDASGTCVTCRVESPCPTRQVIWA